MTPLDWRAAEHPEDWADEFKIGGFFGAGHSFVRVVPC
jgi:hypothetical protein